MKNFKALPAKFLYAIILLAFCYSASAQPGCPAVNAGNNVTLACGTPCTTLTATPFQVGSTTSYTVGTIPYTPFAYNAGTAISLGQDDYWSDTINLPFSFCFYGNVYNQAVVGANGIITFNTYRALQYNPWSLSACVPIPSTSPSDSAFTNCIMGPYQDIDPALGGTIKYQIIGAAPCRILVVSYFQVPMFNTGICPGENCTCQMAIYETTNAIEVYIAAKQTCSAWNSGLAYEGIMDATGANAVTVAGRNLTAWAATNDAYRFTPNGPSIVSVSWYKGATQISTDSTAHVCPSSTSTVYTAKAVYLPCNGGTPVTVTDNVTVSLTGSLNAGVDSVKNISCNGLSDGAAYAHVSGGTAPVTYGWSTGSSNLSITNLAAGTYFFTVTDAGNCVRADTFTITQPTRVGVTGQITNPGCQGSCSGAVVTTDTGGTGGPYTYNWNTNPVQTTQSAGGLCGGPVNVTVTDGNNCSASAAFTLANTSALTINQVSLTNVLCRGESDGSVTVSASGGNGVFNFQWTNNETGPQDTALAAGNYTVTATDTSGCSASATYTITQPANGITLQAPTITNITCAGGSNGSIHANATGGVGTLTYTWVKATNGAHYSGAVIVNLSADTYELTVIDANGCRDTTSYTLTAPPALSIDSFYIVEATCGASNGSAQVFVFGGTGAYSYSWSGHPGVTTSSIGNLPGGGYNVTVADALGCSVQNPFNIAQTSPIVISLSNQTNNLCFGNSTGSLSININGGTSPYMISWSNGVTFSLQDTGLAAGNYGVIVSDVNGCTTTAGYTITQPSAVAIGSPTIQNVGCSGGSTGSIASHVSGGTLPYNYTWVEQSTQQNFSGATINNLSADVYYLTVTDANACSASVNYVVLAVPPLVYTVDSTNVSCFNGNNGSVTVAISSGTRPYQYLFDNTGSIDSVYRNLTAGLVDVIVKDANNCTGHSIVNVQQPTQIVIHPVTQINVLCFAGNNGALSVNATGGTPGYIYRWNNYVAGLADSLLAAGNYTVTVTDTNLCTVSQSFQITQPATPLTTAPTVQNALCHGASDGSMDPQATGGTPPYSYLWPNGSTTRIATALDSGSYSCIVTDANGCSTVATDIINQPTELIILSDSATAVRCVSQRNGTITIRLAGGTPPYTYNATQDNANFVYTTNGFLQGLDTGVYIVTIADGLGCTNQIDVYVPPATLDSFTTSVDSTLCYGYNDGAALATPLPPSSILNGPYKYGIDQSPESSDTGYFQNLSAGLHIITAINTKGCVDSLPVFIPQPLPIEVIITPDSITLPLGGSQQVLVTCLNASNPTYNWTPSNGMSCVDCPNPVVSAYAPGDYLITVSTVNGGATCYGTATLNVQIQRHTHSYTPNAFTPNGDGNNDVFLIYGEEIRNISLKIFNRWGEKVFETTNSLAGWDGTYKGVLQSSGVYIYESIITYLDNTQETKNGSITLIR